MRTKMKSKRKISVGVEITLRGIYLLVSHM